MAGRFGFLYIAFSVFLFSVCVKNKATQNMTGNHLTACLEDMLYVIFFNFS